MVTFKKICALSILLVFSNIAFGQNFKITGKVEGLADGTWLFLRTASPEKSLDSAKINEGKFILKGNIEQKVEQVILYTAKYVDYIGFWIENQPVNISLKKGEFKNAMISGSATQLEQNVLQKARTPFKNQEDSLLKIIKTIQKGQENKEVWNKIYAIRAAEKEMYMEYVKTHPNSIMAGNLLNIYAYSWGKEKTNELYQNLSTEVKNTRYGKNIKNFIHLNKEIKIGGLFADFEQANATGQLIKLSGIKAKYVLLEFWGSWCGPCRAENPNLVKTYSTYKDKGFEILGVAADENKEQWLKAIKDDQLPWENVSDLKGDQNKAVIIYGINSFPTNFLIDEKGIIIAKNLRGDDLKKKLAELLP